MRSFIGFFDEKYIYVYEDEVLNNSTEGAVLCTDSLENLIKSIAINDKDKIKQSGELLFNEMEKIGFNQKNMSINMNYLLYRLIYLAVEQDETVNQEEVMQYISENTFEDGIKVGELEARFNYSWKPLEKLENKTFESSFCLNGQINLINKPLITLS